MKRLMATCAALALAATSTLPMTAFAVEPDVVFSASLNKTQYEVGDTVELTVKIDKNTGSNSWTATIGYDEGLTPFDVYGVTMNEGRANTQIFDANPTAQPIKLAWTAGGTTYGKVYAANNIPAGKTANDAYNWTYTGDVAVISFTVASAGQHTITLGTEGQPFKTAGSTTDQQPNIDITAGFSSSSIVVDAGSPVSNVTVTADPTLNVDAGNSAQLNYSVDPTDTPVSFTSSNTSVATVSDTGLVTGVAGGTATITTTAGGKSATTTVTVNQLTADAALSVAEGATKKLGYEVFPTSTAVTFQSNNTAVATVDANGNVKGVAVGTTTITATAGNLTATTNVTVTDPIKVTDVSFTDTDKEVTLDPNGNFKADYDVYPADATNTAVTFVSNNPYVADVDAQGNITGRLPGTATITITTEDGQKTDDIKVTVDPVDISRTLAVKEKYKLDLPALLQTYGVPANMIPTLLSSVTLNFENANSTIASDEYDPTTGTLTVTGLEEGTDTITVSYQLPGATDFVKLGTLSLTVTDEFVVNFKEDPVSIKVGDSANLALVVTPSDYAFAEDFNDISGWTLTCDDPSVLRIEEKDIDGNVVPTGKVTGLKSGKVVVTATNLDYVDDNHVPIPVTCTVIVNKVLPAAENPGETRPTPVSTDPVGRAKVSPYVSALVDTSSAASTAGPIAATGGEMMTDNDETGNAPAIAAAALGVIALGFVVVARKKRHS